MLFNQTKIYGFIIRVKSKNIARILNEPIIPLQEVSVINIGRFQLVLSYLVIEHVSGTDIDQKLILQSVDSLVMFVILPE